jgi:hypothetical protein
MRKSGRGLAVSRMPPGRPSSGRNANVKQGTRILIALLVLVGTVYFIS